MMKIKKFTCTLLSDVIINQRAATKGNQESLDFIPGSVFLGLAASVLYEKTNGENFTLFHGRHVRFGDAHVLINGHRSLKLPASLYYPKGEKIYDKAYLHHGLPEDGLKDVDGTPIQLKQIRNDYFICDEDNESLGVTCSIDKSFTIKSAYDRRKRRAKDSQMYTYESIASGITMGFEVVFSEDIGDDVIDKVCNALTGEKRIGRSATAQFGLVEIRQEDYHEGIKSIVNDNEVYVYAESRLIFLDICGQFTFCPSASDLGFEKGAINWQKSQVRTFQYAPYNNHRKQRDADRLGIEKGSVLVIENAEHLSGQHGLLRKHVGLFLNEGFGKVLINPEFLQWDKNIAGKSVFKYVKTEKHFGEDKKKLGEALELQDSDRNVIDFLEAKRATAKIDKEVYALVNVFVKDNYKLFQRESFASQWGTIRMKASIAQSKQDLHNKLFDQKQGFLMHGVKKDAWSGNRLNKLRKFFDSIQAEFDDMTVKRIMVNLAAEMAKACKNKEATYE